MSGIHDQSGNVRRWVWCLFAMAAVAMLSLTLRGHHASPQRKVFAALTMANDVEPPMAATREEAWVELNQLNATLQTSPPTPELLAKKIHLGLELDRSQAIATCRQILAADPDNTFALGHLSAAYLMQGQPAAALRYAFEVQKREPGLRTENLIATVFLNLKQFDEAMQHFQNALKCDPANEEARKGLALVAKSAGSKK